MKAADLHKANTAPDNIILFPSQLSRKAGNTRKTTTRIPRADEMEDDMSDISNIRQFSSPPKCRVRALVSEIHGILTKRFGIYGALAIPNMEYAREISSRRLALMPPSGARSMEDSLDATDDRQPAVS